MSNATTTPFVIPADPDIAGVGVRAAIYAQNFMALAIAICLSCTSQLPKAGERIIVGQATAILLTGSALISAAFVQARNYGLDVYHAIVIINLGLINTSNSVMCLSLQQRSHTKPPAPRHVTLWRKLWEPSLSILSQPHLFLGGLHFSLLAAFSFYFWRRFLDGVEPPRITDHIHYHILGFGLRLDGLFLAIFRWLPAAFFTPALNVIVLWVLIQIPMFPLLLLLLRLSDPNTAWPTRIMRIADLLVLIGMDLVLLFATEHIVQEAQPFVEGRESQWTYGQTLAVMLLAIPLVEIFRAFGWWVSLEGLTGCKTGDSQV